jgi:FkbM family methyltransferase
MNYEQKFMGGSIEPWGPTGWHWPVDDTGLWIGPRDDWQHKFKPWIEKHVPNKDTVVQAGGGCGMYPRLLSGMFNNVFTFEPDQQNFYFLNLNCCEPNIRKFNSALGHRPGNVTFYSPGTSNRGEGSIGRGDDMDADPVVGNTPFLMVDNFLFQELNLLFLDIENSEFYALKGSINTITKHRPVIICECANANVQNFLGSLGYVVGENQGADTLFKVENGSVS